MGTRTGEREARAAREAVFAVQAADRTGIIVRGSDRVSWLNGMITCDVTKLGPGRSLYGLLVEKKGRMQTDMYVVPSRADDVLALAVPATLRDQTLATLDHHLVMEDAELEAADLAFWLFVGPRSREAADALAAPFSGALDLTGHGGAIVAAPAAEADDLARRIAGVVADAGGAVGDDAAWEAIRIEHGLPRFGVEVDASLYPQEAALEKLAVSFDKGCYLGQEVVYMLENRGHVKRKLVPLDLEGEDVPRPGDPVTTPDGTAVGDVKSAVLGPLSGKPVAIAMVKWAHSKPGTDLCVGDRPARVRG